MLTGVRCSARYQAEDEHDKCGFSSLNLSQMILSLFFGKISFVLPSCKKKKNVWILRWFIRSQKHLQDSVFVGLLS